MPITYPLSLPGVPARVQITAVSRVGISVSPFTGQQQVYAHQGKFWRASISTPILFRDEAEEWISFLLKLNGPEHTLLLGDDAATTPRGSPAGVPVVDGAGQTGQTLNTRGWTASQTGLLLPGDYIQVDTGSNARLYKSLIQVDSDGAGEAAIDIWPQLRDAPADGTSITTSDAVGLFRLAQPESGWEWQPPVRTQIQFDAVEAI